MASLRGSGFKNLRDLLSFILGAAGMTYYLISIQQSHGHLNLALIGVFATMMGLPLAFGADEKRKK